MKKSSISLTLAGLLGIVTLFWVQKTRTDGVAVCDAIYKTKEAINIRENLAKILLIREAKPSTMRTESELQREGFRTRFAIHQKAMLQQLLVPHLSANGFTLIEVKEERTKPQEELVSPRLSLVEPWNPIQTTFEQNWKITLGTKSNQVIPQRIHSSFRAFYQLNQIPFNLTNIGSPKKNVIEISGSTLALGKVVLPVRELPAPIYTLESDAWLTSVQGKLPSFISQKDCIRERLKEIASAYKILSEGKPLVEEFDSQMWLQRARQDMRNFLARPSIAR